MSKTVFVKPGLKIKSKKKNLYISSIKKRNINYRLKRKPIKKNFFLKVTTSLIKLLKVSP